MPQRFERTEAARGLRGVLAGLLVLPGSVTAQPPEPTRIKRNVAVDARAMLTPRTTAAIDRGLTFLRTRQAENGSFGTPNSESYRANTAITALCGLAFVAGGHTPGRGKHGDAVTGAMRFLLDHAQPNGLIVNPDSVSVGPMYDHGFAMLFLAEVYGTARGPDAVADTRRTRDALIAGVDLIVRSQNREGGWRYHPRSNEADLSVTVCQLMALRAVRNAGLPVPIETVNRAVDYVKALQDQKNGGFHYQLTKFRESEFARSAAAVVALNSAGIYEGEPIRRGLDYVMRFLPREALFPPPGYYYYGHYYAVQAMWQAGGDRWDRWFPAIRDELLTLQQESSGGWVGSPISAEYSTAMALLILQIPKQRLPIFER